MTRRLIVRLALVAGVGAAVGAVLRAQVPVVHAAARHTRATAPAKPAVVKAVIVKPATQPAVAAKLVATKPVATKRVATHVTPAKAGAAAKAPNKAPAIVTIEREQFNYGSDGRRDPFKSLLTSTDLRPMLAELRLVAVAFDPTGAGSVAILREVNAKTQHRVRVGTLLGRMRVASIRPKAVVFTIEELGYSRQETLGLNDSTAVRIR